MTGIARYTVGQGKRLGDAAIAGGERRWWWRWTRRAGASSSARAMPEPIWCACAR